MKRIRARLYTFLPSLVLYRDDLEGVVSILMEHCKRVEIEDNEFLYDGLDELVAKRGKRIESLTIAGRDPYVSVGLKKELPAIHLSTSNESEQSEAAYSRLKLFLLERRTITSKIVHPLVAFIFLMIMLFVPAETIPSREIRWLILATLTAGFLYSLAHRSGILYSISLTKRSHDETFWSRNRDDLFKIVITALVTGLLTWIIARL